MVEISRRQFANLLLLPLTFGVTGCYDRNDAAIVVLLDISASYYKEFTKIVEDTKKLMARLRTGSFLVAEIGACSFSNEAIVWKFKASDRPSERQKQVVEAARRLDDYRRKTKQTQFTDIRGALTQASQYLSGSSAKAKYIIIFSDMDEDLPAGCRRDTRLPAELAGVQVIAANVIRLPEDNRDPPRYANRLEGWRKALTSVGAQWRVMPDLSDLLPLLRDR